MADDYVADVGTSVDRRRRVLLLTLCEAPRSTARAAAIDSASVASWSTRGSVKAAACSAGCRHNLHSLRVDEGCATMDYCIALETWSAVWNLTR